MIECAPSCPDIIIFFQLVRRSQNKDEINILLSELEREEKKLEMEIKKAAKTGDKQVELSKSSI